MADDTDLLITMRLDKSFADAASKAFHAQEQKRIDDDANAQEKADQAYVRAMKQKANAINALANEWAKRQKEQQREQDKADADYIKAVKARMKAEKELADEKEKETRQQQREQDKADQEYVKAVRAKMRAEEQIARQKERETKQQEREQAKADAAYVRAVQMKLRAEKELEEQQKRAAEAADAQTVGVMKAVAAFAGLHSVEGVITSISDHFDKIRADAFRAAEDVMRMRGAVRELAALRGDFGKTGGTMAHLVDVAARTLQRPEDVQQMEEAGIGIGELALSGKNATMTKAEFDKALVAAGKMQTMEGGPAEAYGAAVGQLALSSKEKLSAEQMQAKLYRLFQIQQPGGFRNFGQALQQYGKIQPLIQSGVLSEEKGMALLSAMSTSSPDEAATMVDQFVRMTMQGQLRARGMKVPEGVQYENSAAYMKKIGAAGLNDPLEIGKKIAADIQAQEAKAKAKGQEFSVYRYLGEHGFNTQQERDMAMLFAGLQNKGRMQPLEDAANAKLQVGAPGKGKIDEMFRDRTATDRFYQGRAVELGEQAATLKQGLQEEPLILAQKAAFARLKSQGKISGSFEEWQSTGMLRGGVQDLFFGNYHGQVNREAMHALESERKRLGIEAPGVVSSGSAHEYMLQYARKVEAAGGDVTRGVSDDLAAAAQDIREAAREFREAPKPNMQPVAPPLVDGNGARMARH